MFNCLFFQLILYIIKFVIISGNIKTPCQMSLDLNDKSRGFDIIIWVFSPGGQLYCIMKIVFNVSMYRK